MLDCGTGFRNLGNELMDAGSSYRGRIFITHPHWDHLQGFPFFKPFYDEDSWFRIYLPPQGESGCKDILQGHMTSTFFPVSIDMMEADIECETLDKKERKFEGYTMEYMWANHTIPTAIFKIRVQDKVIIFAPDNELLPDQTPENEAFLKDLKSFIHKADVLIHDAQFNREEYQNRIGWGHSAWEDVVELAKEAQVSQVYLTHHDPDNNDVLLEAREKQIQEQYGGDFEAIALTKEGQEIALPFEKIDKVVTNDH